MIVSQTTHLTGHEVFSRPYDKRMGDGGEYNLGGKSPGPFRGPAERQGGMGEKISYLPGGKYRYPEQSAVTPVTKRRDNM